MCASTGLRHGGSPLGIDGEPFDPLDDREVAEDIAGWWSAQQGNAKITGARARNLNPIIRATPSGPRELVFAWWWIWRHPSGPVKFSAFNSRSDRLMQSWRGEFQHRAIIPAHWYVEKGVRFEHPSGGTLGIAAITSTVSIPDAESETGERTLTSYSLVTREAIGDAATVHDRMPLVLPPERHDDWLDPTLPGTSELALAATQWSDGLAREVVPVEAGRADPNRLF